MNTLLVAFDGSDSSKRALRHAIDVARGRPQTKLHVLHAYEIPLVYGEIALYVSDDKLAEIQRSHSEEILAQAIAILKDSGVPHETEVVRGFAPETIAKRAEALDCSGIVMGTRGLGAIANLVMGSVATKVVHLAKVPVTLVK